MSTKLDLDALRGHTAVDVLAVMDLHLAAMRQGRVPAEAKRYYDDATRKFSEARESVSAMLSELLAYRARDAAVAELARLSESMVNRTKNIGQSKFRSRIEFEAFYEAWQGTKEILADFRQGATRED